MSERGRQCRLGVKTGNSRMEECFPICPRKRTSDLGVNEYTP